MKKKIIIALIILALFIPTYLAAAYYISAQNAPVAERTIEKMTVTDLDGKKFVFDKESKESKQMIAFFVEMNDTAKEVPSLPAQMKKMEHYKAVYRSYNKDKEYKYYFTTNPEEAYYIDAQNKTYSISTQKAVEFLSMQYAESTYEASTEPELTVSNMSILEPYNIIPAFIDCADRGRLIISCAAHGLIIGKACVLGVKARAVVNRIQKIGNIAVLQPCAPVEVQKAVFRMTH